MLWMRLHRVEYFKLCFRSWDPTSGERGLASTGISPHMSQVGIFATDIKFKYLQRTKTVCRCAVHELIGYFLVSEPDLGCTVNKNVASFMHLSWFQRDLHGAGETFMSTGRPFFWGQQKRFHFNVEILQWKLSFSTWNISVPHHSLNPLEIIWVHPY